MKYRVYLRTMASAFIDVEADSEDEALGEAFDVAPSLCAQCSGWGQRAGIELGDWASADEPWDELPGELAVEKAE